MSWLHTQKAKKVDAMNEIRDFALNESIVKWEIEKHGELEI